MHIYIEREREIESAYSLHQFNYSLLGGVKFMLEDFPHLASIIFLFLQIIVVVFGRFFLLG